MILIPKKITWFLGILAILAFGLSGLLINNYGLTIFGIVFVGLLVVNQLYQPYAYTSRGEEKLRQGDYLKAIEDYNQALRLNRHCAYAYYSRGKITTKQKLSNHIPLYLDMTFMLKTSLDTTELELLLLDWDII
jgi:tetratricopeptide (TPR) repeat protein